MFMHLACTKLLSDASVALDKERVAFLDLNRHEKKSKKSHFWWLRSPTSENTP